MFENMSPRERTLAIAVGSLLPIVILFVAFFWFMDRYDANETEINNLTANVEEQEDKLMRGQNASSRRGYYRKTSLPATTGRTQNIYSNWLTDVVQKECKMTFSGPKLKKGGVLIYERDEVAIRNAFTIRPKGTLEQLIQFLHIFYSADHLHRINKLAIKPIGKAQRGKPAVLTGELQLDIEIETLSMADGPEDIASFPTWQRQLPTMDRYTDSILNRNIFGPRNNSPTFSKPGKTKFTHVKTEKDALGKYETVTLSVKDADKKDLLSFELVEKSGQDNFGVVLGDQPRTATTRRIALRVPKQFKPARIPITVRVSDDGLPAKTDEIDFTIVFEAPDVPKVANVEEPERPKDATMTSVIGLMRGNDGRWVARIHHKTKLRSEQFGEGDSMTVDDKEWKVVEVTDKVVTFDVEGERKSFAIESYLDQPIKAL